MGTNGTAESLRNTLAAWQGRKLHRITLPSGQRVKIEMPGLATLLEKGELPASLMSVALLDFTHDGGVTGAMAEVLTTEDQTPEKVMESLSGFTALQRFLACRAVQQVETPDGEWLDVTLDYEEADLFPEDDLAMVAEIVQRLRVHDAAGVTLGVEPIERWATFREEHECAENCAACTRVINAISSIHLDEV